MSFNYKPFFSKISIQGKNQDELSYVFSSGPIDLKKCSVTVFGVFAISSANELYQQFIKQTVKHFVDFYNRVPVVADDTQDDKDINQTEFLFENAIQYVYEKVTVSLIEFQEQRKKQTPLESKKIHCILGCLANNTIYLSSTGTVLRSYYIYPSMNKQGFSRYCVASIIDGQTQDDQSQRLFSNIISGEVCISGGIVCITTLSLLDYLSLEQLKQRITTQEPELFAPSLDKILSKAQARNDMSALCIYPTYTGSAQSDHLLQRTQTAANMSMETLNSRQRGTDTVMSASQSLSIKLFIHSLRKAITTAISSMTALEHMFFKSVNKKILKRYCSAVATICRTAITVSFRAVSDLRKAIQHGQIRQLMTHRSKMTFHHAKKISTFVRKYITDTIASIRSTFLRLPIQSRYLLIFSVLFIALFLYSLVALGGHKKSRQRADTINVIVSSLRQKVSEAEANLLYQNDSGAAELIQEIRQIITAIPEPLSKEQKTIVTTLEKNVIEMEKKLSRITTLDAPQSLAIIDALPDEDEMLLSGSGKNMLLCSSASCYLFAPPYTQYRSLSLLPTITSVHSSVLATPLITYVTNTDGTRLYGTKSDLSLESIPLPFAKAQTRSDRINFYNNALYSYDSASGSIYKHVKRENGFTAGIDWIRDHSIDLHSVVDIDIDGSVYVLAGDNHLYQYANGKPKPIPIPRVAISSGMITRVETDAGNPYLFLLNPEQQSIIVLDKKTHALKTQLTSTVFQKLRDIQLLSSEKSFLVLNNKTLYRIPLNQIQ